MSGTGSRISREGKTISVMVSMYCRRHHGGNTLCPECGSLLEYSLERLKKCPFGEGKTTCAKCPVHCYRAGMREQVRAVMRYSGPRMLWRHPVLALLHLHDGRRKEPLTRAKASCQP